MAQHGKSDRGHSVLVFKHRRTAEKAIRALVNAGVRPERISFFMRAAPELTSRPDLDRALDYGGAIGAGLGVLAGLSLFAIPGLGIVVGTGTVASAVALTILGSSVGGAAGALVGAGISEADAALAEHHLRDGKAVVIVESEGDESKLFAIAHSQGAVELANVENRMTVIAKSNC